MANREKYIEVLSKTAKTVKEFNEDAPIMISLECVKDILELLKEPEAVEPTLEQDSMVCGVCGHDVVWQKMLGEGIWADEELDYCPHCGRKVKWE